MNGPNSVFVALAVLVGVIFFVFAYYKIARWIFSVEQHLENQKKQIELLSKIAKKLEAKEVSTFDAD